MSKLTDRDDMLGILPQGVRDEIPAHWNVFARIRMYSNGPVLQIYDSANGFGEPVYTIPIAQQNWREIVSLQDGSVFLFGGMYQSEARRHVAGLFRDA